MKRILITGGAGFIGSNFIRYYLDAHRDRELVCLDLLTYAGNLDNLNDVKDNPRFKFIRGDIRDNRQVRQALEGCSGVIHFAAESHVDRSIEDADDFLTTNVMGTYTLLNESRRAQVERFLHISTDEVYGSIQKGSFTEESSLEPSSPYSSSKASSDLIALSFYKTYGLPVLVTRSSNNYGPYQYPEKVIPLFITNLLENKKVPLYGDGRNVRDWIFVEDNCRGIDTVFEKGEIGQIYNIGGGNELENIELTHLIIKALERDNSCIESVKDRLGHDRRYSISSEKTRALDWKPLTAFEDGIKKTISWYWDNMEWWKKIKARRVENINKPGFSGDDK